MYSRLFYYFYAHFSNNKQIWNYSYNLYPAFGILALVFVFFKNNWVSKQEVGNEKMARIAKNIADGAMSFLKAEYKILSIFVAAVSVLLFFKGQAEAGSNGMVAVSFIVGAILFRIGWIYRNARSNQS